MYGLESAQLNDSLKRKLDVFFQLKGLRKILGLRLKTTFIERANSNGYVFACAQEALNGGLQVGQPGFKRVVKLSEYYETKRRELTMELIKRRDSDDPRVQLAMQPENLKLREYDKKRIGRPKNVWWHFALKEFWAWIGETERRDMRAVELDIENVEHREIIMQRADAAEE